ncbi:TetR family transcriptional regulator [Gordonia spumicola]|uniref:TetR family transcriptional regulator n=1 Tax=Gordonia spumicola TaxID=589161 RepID=A0A7I9V914_9ACTN|nr:TetR/AcrR family transcriptional regulator [Gordonia spumicola]GEE01639.1 TetR family transcriptional regulator [Gordonia spumicola]GEE01795.1 TetR family transcriptional regulator [Gordonia spumicola]
MEAREGVRTKRTRDPEGARAQLLASGVRLFERRGYAATSVQAIVEDAGLTKGAFYHHFGSKEDLLKRVHDEFINYQVGRARAVVNVPDATPVEKLRGLIVEALLEPMSMYKSEITVFMQERRFLEGELFTEIQRKRDEFEGFFVDVIEQGMELGVFRREGSPRLVAFGVIGMGAWTHVWLDLDGPMTPRQIGEIYANTILGGLVVD